MLIHGNPTSASQAAHKFIAPYKKPIAERVFDFVVEQNGATCAEAERALQGKHQTISARFNELVKAGCLRATEAQRGRPVKTIYEVIPGATFDMYRSWARTQEDPKKETDKIPESVLSAVRNTATILRNTEDESLRQEAMELLKSAILRSM